MKTRWVHACEDAQLETRSEWPTHLAWFDGHLERFRIVFRRRVAEMEDEEGRRDD